MELSTEQIQSIPRTAYNYGIIWGGEGDDSVKTFFGKGAGGDRYIALCFFGDFFHRKPHHGRIPVFHTKNRVSRNPPYQKRYHP